MAWVGSVRFVLCFCRARGYGQRLAVHTEQGAPLPPPLLIALLLFVIKVTGSFLSKKKVTGACLLFCVFFGTKAKRTARTSASRRIEAPVLSTGKKSDTHRSPWLVKSKRHRQRAGGPHLLPVRPVAPTPTRRGGGRIIGREQSGRPGRTAAANWWSNGPPARPCARTRALSICPPPSNHSLRSDPILLATCSPTITDA